MNNPTIYSVSLKKISRKLEKRTDRNFRVPCRQQLLLIATFRLNFGKALDSFVQDIEMPLILDFADPIEDDLERYMK